MPLPAIITVATADLFTDEATLRQKYQEVQVTHILRLRDMYNWYLSNPDAHDRQFVDQCRSRYSLGKSQAYEDLALIKKLLPALSQSSRDFHRWKANEMLLETYRMAKARKDTKTMEKAASAYAKYNRVDIEDEQAMPYDDIVIQPFDIFIIAVPGFHTGFNVIHSFLQCIDISKEALKPQLTLSLCGNIHQSAKVIPQLSN